jgi:GAF domain-containing protein
VATGSPTSSLEALALATRQLQTAGTEDEILRHIVDMAVATVEGCRYAGVSTDRNGRVNSPVVSDPAVLAVDSLQYSLDTGPCLWAMRGPDVLVESADLEHDERFVPFGAEAASQGCRAVLAHRLYVDSQTLGSLNLYASTTHAFSEDDRHRSVILSGVASLTLNAMRLEIDGEGLRDAVRSRDVIGQAKGILMEREQIGADEAFAALRRQSQNRNVKLRELAQQIVDEREDGRA